MTWEIGQHVRDQQNAPRALDRIIARAKAFVIDPDLAEMNDKHCIISDIGGKCFVLNETIDPDAKVTLSTFDAAAHRYSNRTKMVGPDGEEKKKKSLWTWWSQHPQRRQYDRIVFSPGKETPNAYNLWRGFSVTPDYVDSESKCALYLAHIRENICQGDAALYEYVVRWMANGVQRPGEPGGVAIVLRGTMGIGKGVFAQHYGRLFGPHFIPVTNPAHIIGQFNAHMGEAVMLFADECFFAGNPQHEQILKVLVTEKQWLIERKGIDATRSNSCLHIIMSCNNDWAVPVDADDRRFCCLEVGAAHKRDHAYFDAIERQMQDGGYKALLGFLLQMNLTGFRAENFPRTAEHDRQRARTRHGIDAFLEEVCHEGRLPWADATYPDVAITSGADRGRGFDHYISVKAAREFNRMTAGQVKNELKKWGCTPFREPTGSRRTGIRFPSLADLRKAFEDKHGRVEWRTAEINEWEAAGPLSFEIADYQAAAA